MWSKNESLAAIMPTILAISIDNWNLLFKRATVLIS